MSWLLALLMLSPAFAAQFDIKNPGFGTYIRGEYGLAVRGDASYADSSGSGVSFDGTRSSNAGGEFGLVWAGGASAFHVSCEVLLPKRLAGVTGGVNGTPYTELDSKVTVILPQVGLDYVIRAYPESRLLVSAQLGYASVTTQNIYKLKPAGQAAYPSVPSEHTETGKGTAPAVSLSAAYEFEFAEHATLIFDAGYRYLRVSSLKTPESVTTFTGPYSSGDTLKTNGGGTRTLDLGGLFAGAGFRFYF